MNSSCQQLFHQSVVGYIKYIPTVHGFLAWVVFSPPNIHWGFYMQHVNCCSKVLGLPHSRCWIIYIQCSKCRSVSVNYWKCVLYWSEIVQSQMPFSISNPPEGNPTSQFVEVSRLHISSKTFNTRIPLISISRKLFTTSLTVWLPHPLVCGCELRRCLDVHIMLCPSLAAGCCGQTRQVNRADMSQLLLPDTLLKNVNKVGQTRLEWTRGSLKVPSWSFTFVFTLLLSLFLPCCFAVYSVSRIILSFSPFSIAKFGICKAITL